MENRKKKVRQDLFEKKQTQTVSKHNIFENYIEPWTKIISKQHWSRAYYIDAFAGTGKYKTGEAGSPVIAARILTNYQTAKFKFHCVCIEKDQERFNTLEDSLKIFSKVLKIKIYNGEFLHFIDEILKEIKQWPAFLFIDPEGFSGMDYEKIAEILSMKNKEVLIILQYNAIQRWLKAPKVEKTIERLFGTSEYKKAKNEIELIDIYKKQLMKTGAFVWDFRNKFPRINRTYYYLVYATKNIIGFKIMKDVMFSEKSKRYFEPSLLEEVKFKSFQTKIAEKYKGRRMIEYYEVLKFVLQETNYLAKDFNKVIKNLGVKRINNSRKKTNPYLNFPNNRLKSEPNIHRKLYRMIDSSSKTLVERINDGSIITRFDKTPFPKGLNDVVCPHFLELKWAYGCPYDCSWCYLKGTFRFRPEGPIPIIKDFEKIKLHTNTFLSSCRIPEILNTGEIADSLMGENKEKPFSKFIIPMFENQNKHKVLFLTKSPSVNHLLGLDSHKQVIMSFSVNALPVAKKWEKAPSVLSRLNAAKKLMEAGFEVRIRIDPMVPVKNWEKHYLGLIDLMFEKFVPERITLGSLRGLQSTINGSSDKSWVKYLTERSNWGKKVALDVRYEMYSTIIKHLKTIYKYRNVALCKETIEMWKKLKMDFRKIKCNCIW